LNRQGAKSAKKTGEKHMLRRSSLLLFFLGVLGALAVQPLHAEPLPDTKPLDEKGDLAAQMVEGIGKYLDRELAASLEKRKPFWKIDSSSPEAYAKSVEPNRQRLRKILGVVDERVKFADLEYVGGPNSPALLAETDLYKVYAVRWPVLPGVDGEGLLLEPKGKPIAQVVAIPDASWTPEQLVGLAPGVAKEAQYARRLAEDGCRVVVPVLINRNADFSNSAALRRNTNITHREFVYRMAYEMGRHLVGYEVQKILAAVDWFCREKDHPPVAVVGWGEGGMLSFYAGALDERIRGVLVSGYFDEREGLWKETIERNVWARLTEFGDAELALLFARRTLVVEMSDGPSANNRWVPLNSGRSNAAALGHLEAKIPRPQAEFARFQKLAGPVKQDEPGAAWLTEVQDGQLVHPFSVGLLSAGLGVKARIEKAELPKELKDFDPQPRQHRQFDQLVAHVQKLWRDSEPTRAARFAKVDFSSPQKYEKSIEPIREFFWEEVIGKLPAPTEPVNPKTREIYDTPKWKGYEVTLDLYPDVFAYGILLLPKDLKPGEKRPVVVCQHGLEGRPTDVCNPKERTKYYNSFGAQLADLGYIVFAPQNPYIGQDKFRVLQRKANPLKLSLFSFIVRQHERILDWLETLPNVDKDRMAFYGLSYGGKTAMRVPAILKKYCLSICSGDFNEWIGKNVSVTLDRSYMWTFEYEMYEFDLGQTFNYAEMAYLIAPRPFMVERGHDDGVGTDEMVAYEFAKVRYLYENRLKLPANVELEFFVGGHEIHGKGTFAFLKRHLGYPK
jgi:dienelactone hydrolase